MSRRIASLLLLLLLLLTALVPAQAAGSAQSAVPECAQQLADYLHTHQGQLPERFITRSQAKKLGYVSGKHSLSDVAPGFALGGDKFQNREGLLPYAKGRTYYEADCSYVKGARNGERLVYSNDGLYFYTSDGFRSFIQLYPSEDADADAPIIEPQAIADYIFAHGTLPPNFITKREAQAMGWDSRINYVSDIAPGYSIGGDRFGNYEGLLPAKKGRQYYEADCYYTSGKRNAHRIIYSSDGLVYYTADHYQTFVRLYPSEK